MMDSFVEVELFQDEPYRAGDYVYGKLHLFAKKNINDVSHIQFRLFGEEYAVVNDSSIHKLDTQIEFRNTIINHPFNIYSYNELYNVIQAGGYTYPFTIYLPEWLP